MYRFLLRPKWLAFHLIVLAMVVAMVNLGLWQLRRLDARRDFNAVVEARYDASPLPLDDLLAEGGIGATFDPDLVEWRPVVTAGTYLPDETVFVVNRSQYGRAGRNVVVPLRLEDGRIVMVNRGFVPLQIEEIPGVPADTVAILGRLRASEERRRGQLSDAADGDLVEVQRVDLERLATQLPGEVVPMYIDLAASEPPESGGLPQPVTAPALGQGNHLSYAVQWLVFSACAVAGWVIVVRRTAIRRPPPATHGPQ